MPLIDTGKEPFMNDDRSAVGLWLKVEGSNPPQFVTAFVPYKSLELKASPPIIEHGIDTFIRHHDGVVAATNDRYDAGDFDTDYNGQRSMILRPRDRPLDR